jgi:hypothetical protein
MDNKKMIATTTTAAAAAAIVVEFIRSETGETLITVTLVVDDPPVIDAIEMLPEELSDDNNDANDRTRARRNSEDDNTQEPDNNKQIGHNQMNRRLLMAAVVVIIAIVGALVGLFLTRGSNFNSTGSTGNGTSNEGGTQTQEYDWVTSLQLKPNMIEANSAIFETVVIPMVEEKVPSSATKFMIETTAQHDAVEWLVRSHNLDLIPPDRIIQRYVLAVVFFETGGEDEYWRIDEHLITQSFMNVNGTVIVRKKAEIYAMKRNFLSQSCKSFGD